MKTRHIFTIPALVLFLTVPSASLWAAHGGHEGHGAAQKNTGGQSSSASIYTAKGKITQVEKGAKKLIIDHEPVPSLNWPRMVMGFEVEDASLLDGLKAGDNIRFDFQPKNASGNTPIILEIEILK